MSRGDVLAIAAEEGAVVDGEGHRHRGFVYGYARQRLRVVDIGHCIADFKSFDAHQCANIAAADLADTLAAHTLKDMQFLDTLARDAAVLAHQGYIHTLAQSAAVYASHCYTAYVIAVIQRSDQHLCVTFKRLRRRDVLNNSVQQRQDIVCGFAPVRTHPTLLGRAEKCREIELIFCGIKIEHQVENHLLHLFGATIGLIHFVYDDNGLKSYLKRFLKNETRLGHRPFESIDQQKAAIGHIEHALHFAAEIGVSRSVYNVDFCPFVIDGDVFGEYCYAALALKVIAVEYQFAGILIISKKMSGHQHFVHKGGLAMVHVGDDGDIAYILHIKMCIFLISLLFQPAKLSILADISIGKTADEGFSREICVSLRCISPYASACLCHFIGFEPNHWEQ